jgi:transposase
MSAALGSTRMDPTSADLRALSGTCADGAQVRRVLALALVLDGGPRSEAAAPNGMDRQTLRDWVPRYNADGMEGLNSRQPPGRVPALTKPPLAELRELVVKGPDPAKHDVVRWRCVDIQAEVAGRVSIDGHTVGKWLNRFGLTRLQPRPYHPRKDVAAAASFKKLRLPGQNRVPRHHRRDADRNLAPGGLSAEEAINGSARREPTPTSGRRLARGR